MSWGLRVTEALLARVHADLDRSHSHALERVGFLACRTVAGRETSTLLAYDYLPIEDACYLQSHEMGALIDAAAIRSAMQRAYREQCSIVHVHRHEHPGLPGFSLVDDRESAKLMPTFWNVAPRAAHGALVLSFDRAHGRVWDATDRKARAVSKITCVGIQLKELS